MLQRIVSERTTPLVVWVGAGLSVPAGMPTWAKLRNELIAALRKKSEEIGEGKKHVVSKLQAAEALADEPWRCFQLLREGLGPPQYEAKIRDLIQPAKVLSLPEGYTLLEKLGPRGILNLNIDRLATRAVSGGAPAITEFDGIDVEDYFHVFRSPHKFIVNLHGDIERVSSWVFTESELRDLTSRAAYQRFLEACLTQFCSIFIGISPHDVAVGGHLDRVAAVAPSSGPHYWFTSYDSHDLDIWAQRTKLIPIRYKASNEDHGELYQLIGRLVDHKSFDVVQEPSAPQGIVLPSEDALDPPEVLSTYAAEDIRLKVNARASYILGPGSPSAYKEFEEFSHKYEVPIYRAWHVSDRAPNNILLGFKLLSKAGGGAFGTVYKAISKEGEQVAIKVLRQDARGEGVMLQAFRRGIRAMRILTAAGVQGVSQCLASSEIPAMVVMNWIDGPTLKELVASKVLAEDVARRLDIAIQLAETIRRAHALPQRVLHRDIRPTNIMLRDYWNSGDLDVVVLDFDLSWHKDSQELSVIQGASSSGYLAPEQLDAARSVPTRSGLVDSFGIGMTVFHIFSSRDPLPDESLHASWKATLRDLAMKWNVAAWKSFGNRLSRLIEISTRGIQSKRWDVSQISGELSRLKAVLDNQADVSAADLLAEELLARVYPEYIASDDGTSFTRVSQSGISMEIGVFHGGNSIKLRIRWTDSGQNDHKRVKKWVEPALSSVAEMLESVGWVVLQQRSSNQDLEIVSTVDPEMVAASIDRFSASLTKVSERLIFA